MKKLAWHFDFHSHREVRIGHRPDPEGIASSLAAAGVEEIIHFAKCHTGFSYFPTRVGFAHPQMEGDPFGEVMEACRRHGVRVLAYVSFGVDGEIARRHPDYAQYHAPGQCMANDDHFICVCPFTPYIEAYFLPHVREIIELYRPDGFFFDTMSAFNPCFCQYCQADYRAATGAEIPAADSDPGRDRYGQWRHDRALRLIARVGDFITELLPEAEIGFNQIGTPPYPEAMPPSIRRLTLDFATFGAQSRQASLSANYGSTAAIPSDVMPTRFNEGWGDWSPAPALALEQVSAPVLAFRQRLYMGDRLHPQNRLTEGTVSALDTLSRLWREMAAQLPPDHVPRQPDAIVLHTTSSMYGEDMRYFSVGARDRLVKLNGAHRLLIDAGINFAICAETSLESWLRPDRVLILPEQPSLTPATDALIRAHLAAGGQVMAFGRVPRVNGEAVDWLGVSEEPAPWQDHLWLPWLDSSAHPILVRGDCHRLRLAGATAELHPFAPYDLRHGIKMGWGINPPADQPDESPVLTRHEVGKGVAWLAAVPLCTHYAQGLNYQQAIWVADLFARCLPPPAQGLLSRYGSVELIPYAAGNTTWSVLLNHAGEEFAPQGRVPWPRTVGPLPAIPVELFVRDPQGRRAAAVTSGGSPIEWDGSGGEVRIPLTLDTLWRVITIDWQ